MIIEIVAASAIVQAANPIAPAISPAASPAASPVSSFQEYRAEDIRLTATLLADRIQVGETYEIAVSLELGDGWSTSDAGIPTPLLQIDVPDSVRLSGKVLEGYRALSRNEFINEPFERRFEGDTTTVGFTVEGDVSDGDVIGLNVVTYARHEDGRIRFVRRRVDVPIKPGATASSSERAEHSDWGRNLPTDSAQDTGLQIGDHAAGFDLPRADGSKVNLDDYLGKSNIIVTTYRAYW